MKKTLLLMSVLGITGFLRLESGNIVLGNFSDHERNSRTHEKWLNPKSKKIDFGGGISLEDMVLDDFGA